MILVVIWLVTKWLMGIVLDSYWNLRVGLVLNQFVVSIEISCLPKDLPHGIDVDVSSLALGEHLSLTDLVLPEGVTITSLQHEDVEAHDQTVCSVTEPKIIIEEEIEEPVDGELEGEEGAEGAEGAKDEGEAKGDEAKDGDSES